jgi:hypothetical protein
MNKVKPTVRQRRAAAIMVANGGRARPAMAEAGYSLKTAQTPSKLTESRGFLQIAKEVGLTPELISTALTDDIQNKPGNRAQELTIAGRWLGVDKQADQPLNVTAIQITFGD